MKTLLDVRDVRTYFHLDEGVLKAVDGVSFDIGKQETLGIIGESGSGKSVTAQSIMRIVPKPGRIRSGEILLHHDDRTTDLTQLKPFGPEIRSIRGKDIAMIFQEPMTSLSPVHTIGNQIREAILLHRTEDRKEAEAITLDMLSRVGISNPKQRVNEYPHQLSGGMRQRAMIAMALSCNPKLLIADEPTTALDVTVQAQILELIKELQEQFHMSVLYITHDLGVIAEVCDKVAVMYLGRVVEYGSVRDIFYHPLHPYTVRLLKSMPKMGHKQDRLEAIEGNVPIPLDPPVQCGFVERCTEAMAGRCEVAVPALVEVDKQHWVRCYLHSEE
ncbi:MAG: ABC transporter ATP-binding protein [Trueperaceae bacterium]|nr:MAG: ABC transporter ATP-binding protein [Trueperaceae bacterium]